MATYGFAGVSTPKQDIERQARNLPAYDPSMTIYREQYSAGTTARTRFRQPLSRVREGDTIVLDEVGRMSRDADEGL